MHLRAIAVLGMALGLMASAHAQDAKSNRQQFNEFVQNVREEFDGFRKSIMEEFTSFVRNPWREFKRKPAVPKPQPENVPPEEVPAEDRDRPVVDRPVPIDQVVVPVIDIIPQPRPVEPILEVRVPRSSVASFSLYGTPMQVRYNRSTLPQIRSLTENDVADALTTLGDEDNNNTITDCLRLRDDYNLSDWAYLQLLNTLSRTIYPDSPNDANLLTAYLFMRSGYRMRMAMDSEHLYMLYASRHNIFNQPSFFFDDEYYYCLETLPSRLRICQAAFPGEQSLSLLINRSHKFAEALSPLRSLHASHYPEMQVNVAVNTNLLDFYSSYPSSMVSGDMMTRWAQYANTPLDATVSGSLYPELRKALDGKSKHEATDMLLNFVQTGFVYGYDDEVWGADRAFFAEETFFYPFSDCEDRAILFTRLVRDLTEQNCLLLYYPGHLAAAVELDDPDASGDYVMLDDRKYIVADPTYINARVGRTMPGMNNQTAKVILLQ